MEDDLLGLDLDDAAANEALSASGYWTIFGYSLPWYVWLLSAAALIVLLIVLFKTFKPRK